MKFVFRVLYFYGISYILLVPFSYYFLPIHPFLPLYNRVYQKFNSSTEFVDFSSDSFAYFCLILSLILGSILVSFLLNFDFLILKKWKGFIIKTKSIVYFFLLYFIVLQLWIYGFDKLFLIQFPVPEGNLLHTPLGQLHRETVFWSLIGCTPFIQKLLGFIELLVGFGLCFYRFRFPFLLLTSFVLGAIFAINYGFDIDVKGHSLSLFIISICLLEPYKEKFKLFVENSKSTNDKKSYLQFILIFGLLISSIYPYLKPVKKSLFSKLTGTYQNRNLNDTSIQFIHFHSDKFLILEDRKLNMNNLEIVGLNSKYLIVKNENETNDSILYELNNSFLKLKICNQDIEFEKVYFDSIPFMDNKMNILSK